MFTNETQTTRKIQEIEAPPSLYWSIAPCHETAVFTPVVVSSERMAAQIASQSTYCITAFRDHRRNRANAQGAGTMVLDFDNRDPENQIPFLVAREKFKTFQFVAHATPSHRKACDKNPHGLDRFRIILFLEKIVQNPASFTATVESFLKDHGLSDHPAIDKHSRQIEQCWAPGPHLLTNSGGLVGVVESQVQPNPVQQQTPAITHGLKGKLAEWSHAFLNDGTIPENCAGRNDAVNKVAYDMRAQGYSQEEVFAKILAIPSLIASDFPESEVISTIHSAYSATMKYDRRGIDDGFRDKVWHSLLFYNESDAGETYLVDTETLDFRPIDVANIRTALGKDDFAEYSSEMIRGKLIYDPRAPRFLQGPDGVFLNTYRPPQWRFDNYYRGTPVRQVVQPPRIISDFLLQLVDGDIESFEFIQDFITEGLWHKNETNLVSIGEQGVGKNLFGQLCQRVFGSHNSHFGRDEVLKRHFNGQLRNKTFLHLDEINLNDEAISRLKILSNPEIEIESKGKDAISVKNYLNIYISSNSYDALGRIEPGDRRYSIINLTQQRFVGSPVCKQFDELEKANGKPVQCLWDLCEKEVADFACFLWHRKISRNMFLPFRAKYTERINFNQSPQWTQWILTEYAQDRLGRQPVAVSDVQQALREFYDDLGVFGNGIKVPGRRLLEKASKNFPGVFKVVREPTGARIWKLHFSGYLDSVTLEIKTVLPGASAQQIDGYTNVIEFQSVHDQHSPYAAFLIATNPYPWPTQEMPAEACNYYGCYRSALQRNHLQEAERHLREFLRYACIMDAEPKVR